MMFHVSPGLSADLSDHHDFLSLPAETKIQAEVSKGNISQIFSPTYLYLYTDFAHEKAFTS